ncbi:MAG: methyl-accepting chemotaxis protein [Eubacteriales bacterium]
MFKQMKISTYLISCFGLLVACTVIITFAAITGFRSISADSAILVDETLATQTAVSNMRYNTQYGAASIREMALTDNVQDYAKFATAITTAVTNINAERAFVEQHYKGNSALLSSYLTSMDSWIAIASEGVAMLEAGRRSDATSLILYQCSPTLEQLATASDSLNAALTAITDEATASSTAEMNMYMYIILAIFCVSLVFSIFAATSATNNIVNGLNLISGYVDELSKGNLDVEIDYEAKNAIGRLAATMKFSFHELGKYVHTIERIMTDFANGNFRQVDVPFEFLGDFAAIGHAITNFNQKINFVLGDVSETSGQVYTGAEQVSVGAQSLAAGATEQASSIEELSATINEISAQVTRTAENSLKADGLAKATEVVVDKSLNEMRQLLTAIEDIAEASEGISKIIKSIDDIAFQTNILALNAAVEAARAGQAGKGFAVVADEVRNLAGKSAEAAKHTTELIENSLDSVRRGTALADNTNEAFKEVATNSNQVLGVVGEIAEASKEQASSVAQVLEAVNQISSVVQMNSATSEESAAASEELSGQATVLKSLIGQFQLTGSAAAHSEDHHVENHQAPAHQAPVHNDKY